MIHTSSVYNCFQILEGTALNHIPSPASPATVRGIPLSVVEEECAEISRRINQASFGKGNSTGIVVNPVNTTTQSDLSQISGTILVHATNAGMIKILSQLRHFKYHY